MRLIVCSTRAQVHNLKAEYPDDKLVVVGEALHALRVTGIVDRTFHHPTGSRREFEDKWWEHAQCRLEPQADAALVEEAMAVRELIRRLMWHQDQAVMRAYDQAFSGGG